MMSLPGSLDVSQTGAANYVLPIAVPPGTAGMAPSLQFEFSSQGGNGIVGVNWALGGLPAVVRCPRTIATDGVNGSVNFDLNDRYCLDGQRLIAISGPDGGDGTEYRTEIESFSRVLSHGVAGNGPAWFQVFTKSGQILEFGNTTDSQILAQGKTSVRSWAVNKVSDTKGNYFTATYTQDAANGQAYPSRIDYTGNTGASLTPYNSVQFSYNTSRPDITPLYQAGSLLRTTVLLTDVKTFTGTTLVSDYQITYNQSGSTGRSRITSIKLCAGDGSCLPATAFTWQDGGNLPVAISNNLAAASGDGIPTVCDFGDGIADLLWYSGRIRADVRLNDGDGQFSNASTNNVVPTPPTSGRAICGDFTGIGYSSILWDVEDTNGRSTGTRILWINSPTGFTAITNVSGQDGTLVGYVPYVGDFTGDGRADILWDQEDTNGLSTGTRVLWISKGDGTFTVVTNVAGANGTLVGAKPYIAELNGDGKGDVLWDFEDNYRRSTGTRVLWTGNGDGTFTVSSNVAGQDGSLSGYALFIGDFNGDGRSDILWDNEDTNHRSAGQRVLWTSKGDGTFVITSNLAGQDGQLVGAGPFLGDFNGDGKTDILWLPLQNNTSGQIDTTKPAKTWQSANDYSFTVLSFTPSSGTAIPIVGQDYRGDGKSGILWVNTTGAGVGLQVSDGLGSDRMVQIATGLGAQTLITYSGLAGCANRLNYTYESNSTYPVLSAQGAMTIVTRVDASNGLGVFNPPNNSYANTYSYAGARVDMSGRGFLGFHTVTVTDIQTNIQQVKTYRQDYPYIGVQASQTKTLLQLHPLTLNTSTKTYTATGLGGTRNFVGLTQTQEASTDLDGTAMPTVTTTYQYDTYGNPTQIVVSTPDGYSKTTTNTYTNDTVNWFLGRLTQAVVTSTTP